MKIRAAIIRWEVLLFVIPALLLLTGHAYRNATGTYFLATVDPEFAYLINGVVMGDLHPDIYYVDHPGTPLICMIAIVSRMVHLFRPGTGFVADVMANPEIYIRASVLTANMLTALALLILGWFLWRRTRKILPALVFQCLAFVHTLSLEPLSRLIPESLMTVVVCCWLILLTDLIISRSERWKGAAVWMGILYGFSVALKLTLLPYLFIPMLVLPRWRYRLLSAGIALVSFLIFAFPVLWRRIHFVNWVRDILIHTGKYGQGDQGFAKMGEFREHLQQLIGNNHVLLAATILLALAVGFQTVRILRGHTRAGISYRLGIAMIIIVILQFVMAAKQFSYHYMLPAILLTLPSILLAFSLIFREVPAFRWLVVAGPAAACVWIAWDLFPRVSERLPEMEQINKKRQEALHQYQALKMQAPTLVVCSYYGCSAVEYGLSFGIQESGKYADYLTEHLHALYPETWLYYPWAKSFYDGRRAVLPEAFLKRNEYNLLVAGYTGESDQKLADMLDALPGQKTIEKVYADGTVSEALFRLRWAPSPH